MDFYFEMKYIYQWVKEDAKRNDTRKHSNHKTFF